MSRGSKSKSKSSSCKIEAEELSQIEEFGQHIGFKWGGNKTRDSTVGEVGLDTNDKVDWIRELCYKEKPDVVGIHETKLRKLDFKTINKLWGSNEVDFIKLDVVGRSGGILTMWDTRVFNKVQVISDHGFVAVVGKWVGVEKMTGLVNVYGPRNENERVALWDRIRAPSDTCWCTLEILMKLEDWMKD
ncbi:RNA-directed DNA polymerase, eukaryota [Tanacetum coccineum]